MSDINASPPFRYCPYTQKVFGRNTKIGGDSPVCDIRGWGHLTGQGHGALGLDNETAAEIMDQTGRMIAELLNREFPCEPTANSQEE